MKFHKMHGAGNDYIYIDLATEKVEEPSLLAKIVSDRHFGIGGDGIILIAPSEKAGGRMIMYNADGSEGAMCGNGVRCIAKYLFDNGRIGKKSSIETKSGIVGVEIAEESKGKAVKVRVDMGNPRLRPNEIPTLLKSPKGENEPIIDNPITVNEKTWRVTCVSMGNPHAVIFMNGIDRLDLETVGPGLENHQVFPERANIEFVEVISKDRLRQRTWERGSGETMACGSGACAVLVAANLNRLCGRSVEIELRGGILRVELTEENRVLMTGPATHVFEGEFDLQQLLKNLRQ